MFLKANVAIVKRFISLGVLVVTFLALSMPTASHALAAASAVTFTVDTTLDLVGTDLNNAVCPVGSCSLRAAIMHANKIPNVDVTINLPSGLYDLTQLPIGADGEESGDLNLTSPTGGNPIINIIGAGAATTIIDGKGTDRILTVAINRAANISGVTIRNGNRPNLSGGGIYNSGILSITDCVIERNQTGASGGGILNDGPLTITRSTIRSNKAYSGGGIYVRNATTIRDSTLSSNGATYGGGIEVSSAALPHLLIIVNSTLSQNYADTDGGGIDNEGTTFLYNTSIIDNDADHDGNLVPGGIGGGVNVLTGKRFVVVNSLIARNTVFNQPVYDDCHGNLESYGWNLLGELLGCTFTGNGGSQSIIALDSFGPLQNNGGSTQTHALLAGSTAIDSTFAQGCVDENGAALTADQRGAPRGTGIFCDIGAFEYHPLHYIYLPGIRR